MLHIRLLISPLIGPLAATALLAVSTSAFARMSWQARCQWSRSSRFFPHAGHAIAHLANGAQRAAIATPPFW